VPDRLALATPILPVATDGLSKLLGCQGETTTNGDPLVAPCPGVRLRGGDRSLATRLLSCICDVQIAT